MKKIFFSVFRWLIIAFLFLLSIAFLSDNGILATIYFGIAAFVISPFFDKLGKILNTKFGYISKFIYIVLFFLVMRIFHDFYYYNVDQSQINYLDAIFLTILILIYWLLIILIKKENNKDAKVKFSKKTLLIVSIILIIINVSLLLPIKNKNDKYILNMEEENQNIAEKEKDKWIDRKLNEYADELEIEATLYYYKNQKLPTFEELDKLVDETYDCKEKHINKNITIYLENCNIENKIKSYGIKQSDEDIEKDGKILYIYSSKVDDEEYLYVTDDVENSKDDQLLETYTCTFGNCQYNYFEKKVVIADNDIKYKDYSEKKSEFETMKYKDIYDIKTLNINGEYLIRYYEKNDFKFYVFLEYYSNLIEDQIIEFELNDESIYTSLGDSHGIGYNYDLLNRDLVLFNDDNDKYIFDYKSKKKIFDIEDNFDGYNLLKNGKYFILEDLDGISYKIFDSNINLLYENNDVNKKYYINDDYIYFIDNNKKIYEKYKGKELIKTSEIKINNQILGNFDKYILIKDDNTLNILNIENELTFKILDNFKENKINYFGYNFVKDKQIIDEILISYYTDNNIEIGCNSVRSEIIYNLKTNKIKVNQKSECAEEE